MAFQGVGTGFNVAVTGSAAVSAVWEQKSPYLRCVSSGSTITHVAISTYPTAAATDTVISSQQPEIISLGQVITQNISTCTIPALGAANVGIATLTVPEGMGSQFIVGNILNLSVAQGTGSTDAQAYYNLTNLYVSAVNTRRVNVPDMFQDQIEVTGNFTESQGAGIATALFSENKLTARKAFRVGTIGGTAQGKLFCQQVQITGG